MSRVDRFSKEEFEQICKESYSMEEICRKVGYSSNSGSVNKIVKNKIDEYGIDISHLKGQGWNAGVYDYSKFKYGSIPKSPKDSLVALRGHQCESCMNKTWLGHEIPLEVHHIDGDRLNNVLENLQLLCPNCHAMTDNYCKRKTGKHLERTDDEYAEALRTTNNIRAALLKLGITSYAGYYYDRARNVIQRYNINQPKEAVCNCTTYTVNHERHTVSEWASILEVNKSTFRKYIAHLSDSDIELAISKCIEHIGDKQYISNVFLSMKNTNKNVLCNKNKDIEKIDIVTHSVVGRYHTLSEAAISIGKEKASHISSCCNGKEDVAYGYIWRYVDRK